ncbi:uncharacterized protein METZ01_LOCUS426288, partial [marine metagenome]
TPVTTHGIKAELGEAKADLFFLAMEPYDGMTTPKAMMVQVFSLRQLIRRMGLTKRLNLHQTSKQLYPKVGIYINLS